MIVKVPYFEWYTVVVVVDVIVLCVVGVVVL